MKRAVIISGGNIEEDFALCFLEKNVYDYVIAADSGLLFLQKYGRIPTHIVGDFDSLAERSRGRAETAPGKETEQFLEQYRQNPKVTIRTYQPEKDWTDTEIAAELALELGCGSIDILGATGTRLDHVMGNIQLLALILERGAQGCLMDARNRIYIKDREFILKRQEQWGTYVSLFAYGEAVTGLTLKGMKYPLEEFTLGTVGTRGVSNEIADETARVSFKSGKLLVMETRD